MAELYTRHANWLVARLAKQYGAQDAEDLIQEAWLRLAPYRLDEIRHPRAFILRVAANLVANRSGKLARGRDYAAGLGGGGLAGAELPSQAESVLMKELILSLPEPLRDVFLLSRLDGLTNAQIGERLGISPKTVEWRMTRALAHCAAQLRR